MNIWRWLTEPDSTPGLSTKKVTRLLIKSVLFAFVAVTAQVLLRMAGLKIVDTWWGTAIIVLLLYIPFARFLAVDMAQPPSRARPGGKKDAGRYQKVDRRRYAGVKKGGPRFK